jgi:hypothetical protein
VCTHDRLLSAEREDRREWERYSEVGNGSGGDPNRKPVHGQCNPAGVSSKAGSALLPLQSPRVLGTEFFQEERTTADSGRGFVAREVGAMLDSARSARVTHNPLDRHE